MKNHIKKCEIFSKNLKDISKEEKTLILNKEFGHLLSKETIISIAKNF